QGRHEPGGAPAVTDEVPAPVYSGAGAAPRGPAGHHRLGAGERPERHQLGGAISSRRVVRGPSVADPRPRDPVSDRAPRRRATGHHADGQRQDAGLHRDPRMTSPRHPVELPSSEQPRDYYDFDRYISPQRMLTYWHQIREVMARRPARVLEVGVGTGLVASYLRASGIDVTTVDINEALEPDVVGSVQIGRASCRAR